MKTASREEMIRLAFSTPKKRISKKEQQRRKELPAAIETLIGHFQSKFKTDVVGIDLYPCDCTECVQLL
jgi:hypothetical protein